MRRLAEALALAGSSQSTPTLASSNSLDDASLRFTSEASSDLEHATISAYQPRLPPQLAGSLQHQGKTTHWTKLARAGVRITARQSRGDQLDAALSQLAAQDAVIAALQREARDASRQLAEALKVEEAGSLQNLAVNQYFDDCRSLSWAELCRAVCTVSDCMKQRHGMWAFQDRHIPTTTAVVIAVTMWVV